MDATKIENAIIVTSLDILPEIVPSHERGLEKKGMVITDQREGETEEEGVEAEENLLIIKENAAGIVMIILHGELKIPLDGAIMKDGDHLILLGIRGGLAIHQLGILISSLVLEILINSPRKAIPAGGQLIILIGGQLIILTGAQLIILIGVQLIILTGAQRAIKDGILQTILIGGLRLIRDRGLRLIHNRERRLIQDGVLRLIRNGVLQLIRNGVLRVIRNGVLQIILIGVHLLLMTRHKPRLLVGVIKLIKHLARLLKLTKIQSHRIQLISQLKLKL